MLEINQIKPVSPIGFKSYDNAVAYCRVSTLKSEQELSLENQMKFFDDYITKRGDKLIHIYGEHGKSATKMHNRPELQQLIKDAKTGKFKRVYIKDISRAFRNTYDFIGVSRELAQYGVIFHVLGLGDSGRDVDEFTLQLLAMLAEEESKKMSARVKFGKELGRAEGVVPNFVFGYDKVDRTTLKINEDEAYWVKRIFDLYTVEGWGQCRIAEELSTNKVITKKKKNGEPNHTWSTTTVGKVLSNELYTGKLISGKERMKNLYTYEREKIPREQWVIHERPELRIISDEQFAKAQKKIHAAGKKMSESMKKGRTSNAHLFSNLIKCGTCGFSYRRWTRKPTPANRYKNEYAWWTCSHRTVYGKDSCPSSHIRIDEKWLMERLADLLNHIIGERDEFFASIEKKCTSYIRQYIAKQSNTSLDELREQEDSLTKERDRIKDMARRGMLDMDEAEADMKSINTELKRIKIAIAETDKTDELVQKVKASMREFIQNFSAIDFTQNLDNLHLKRIIREIRVMSKEEIYVYFNVGDDGIDIPFALTDSVIFNTECNHGTQGHLGAAAPVQPGAVSAGEGSAGCEQGAAAHPGRHRHPQEISRRVAALEIGGISMANRSCGGRRQQVRTVSARQSALPTDFTEPAVRRWPHPVDGTRPAQTDDPALHYIRCALSYQNQLLGDIKTLLEKLAAECAAEEK